MNQKLSRYLKCLAACVAVSIVLAVGGALYAEADESELGGIWLEENTAHFDMVQCPICLAAPEFQGYASHAYHSDPGKVYIKCRVTPASLMKEPFFQVFFEGEGVINDQAIIFGTLTGYGPECYREADRLMVVPHVLGTQNIAVQCRAGELNNLTKRGTPAQLTVTTSELPAPSIEGSSTKVALLGSAIDVLGSSDAGESLLTMNRSASVISRFHPQMVVSAVSSNPSVVKVDEMPFDSETAPDNNPYINYRVQCIRAGNAVVTIKDALGNTHAISLIVTDKASLPTSLAKAFVAVKSKTWTGKALKPAAPVVKLGGKTLRAGTDYTWSCKSGKAVGSYKVTITGKGAYAGTATATFKILPKGTSVSKLSRAKKAFTVKWKALSKTALKQVTGYQVRWSTSKKFAAKTTKTKTVKAASAAGKKRTLKVAKLKAKKTYYVQVRTYKKVGRATYCSAWSKTMKVKTK